MELTKRQMDIIHAAITIIARQGLKDLTTKNLARELGLTEAALYRHFDSKGELIRAILHYFGQISGDVIREIGERNLAPLERVRMFVMNRYRLFIQDPDLAKVLFSEELFRTDPALSGEMQAIMHSHREAVEAYIREAQQQGAIRSGLDPLDLFRVVVGSMRFLVTQWNLSGQTFDLVAEGEKLFNTITKLTEE
jgi:AcrR family transcriptional regulator